MTIAGPHAQGPLGQGYSRYFGHWLGDTTEGGAGAAVRQALASDNPVPGRLFPDQMAGLVVTGQQPGFLGGPLYTLYKIATAVELAARRTRDGRPTIPVFWSGDDDSDLGESMAPLAWDETDGKLRSSPGRALVKDPRYRRRMAGTLASGDVCGWATAWLAARAAGSADDLVKDLAQLHRQAVSESWSLSALNHAVWFRCFSGSGLIILSGNDPQLHEAAAPLTQDLRRQTPQVMTLVRDKGRELVEAGWHAQLDERSLRSPWYVVQGNERQPVANDAPVEAGRLRPGVLMRSVIQDWLLNPVCVVVGPGEFAYLKQMEPLYKFLDIPRSPLVPRMGGTLVPAGHSVSSGRPEAAPSTMAQQWTSGFIQDSTERLVDLIHHQVGVDLARSRKLAAGRTRRWQRGLVAMLANLAREQTTDGAVPWVRPGGKLQERTLAAFNALGLGGSPLRDAVMRGASYHVAHGLENQWQALVWETEIPGEDS